MLQRFIWSLYPVSHLCVSLSVLQGGHAIRKCAEGWELANLGTVTTPGDKGFVLQEQGQQLRALCYTWQVFWEAFQSPAQLLAHTQDDAWGCQAVLGHVQVLEAIPDSHFSQTLLNSVFLCHQIYEEPPRGWCWGMWALLGTLMKAYYFLPKNWLFFPSVSLVLSNGGVRWCG